MTAPDPRLDEIQARLSAATPGPWFREYGDVITAHPDPRDVEEGYEDPRHVRVVRAAPHHPKKDRQAIADATFIANAPADVSYLLAELRKAHEALARVEGLAGELATHSEGRALDFTDDDFDRGWHGANRLVVDQLRAAVAAANGDGNG